jgi:ABC-type polysaccharide/polyol phosphate transport system ATPase subunit
MSSSKSSIQVDDVTKEYRIYSNPIDRFRDALGWRSKFKEFSALSNVSFKIAPGEFWGVVGKNGSGKSTLLKIVANQLQPTSGSVTCHGSVALLQLGLGFDPELTGIENIRHSRLLQNLTDDFEEVVSFVKEFSELGDFVNYPVKTYSSGMYSRLAFATAIAGDPDILIADEVLAVGDMSFAQKCLAKMREFKDRGKTVVLVTHDVATVKSFCDRAIWLDQGKAIAVGAAKFVADDFRNFMLYGVINSLNSSRTGPEPQGGGLTTPETSPADPKWTPTNASRRTVSNGDVEIPGYRFADASSQSATTSLQPNQSIELQINCRFLKPSEIYSFGVTLHDRNGMIAVHLNSEFFGGEPMVGSVGEEITARFLFAVPSLANGDYSISLGCSDRAGRLMEKFDHDSTVQICQVKSPVTDRQGGYAVISSAKFSLERHV